MPIPEAHAVTPPGLGLGTADSYAVFGAAGVTNTGASTHIWGDVGANSSVTGLNDATQVDGTIKVAPATDGVATDASSTYDSLMDGSQGTPEPGIFDLAGTHTGANAITPGVYNVGATIMDGAVELSGEGVYIFRSDSSATISTSGTAVMTLTNGACASKVFWAIPASMTIGTYAHIEGTIIAQTGLISLATGATLVGRAISLTKQVTLDANQITKPTCAVATPTPTPTPTPTASPGLTPSPTPTPTPTSSSSSSSPSSSSTSSEVCLPLNYVAPIIIESRRIDADSIFISWGPYSGINTFLVEYGPENGKWLYNTRATGFSTTINALPLNQPIWVRITATDYCSVGVYGESKLVGGPSLPYTGMDPHERSVPWSILIGIFLFACFIHNFIIIMSKTGI